MTSISKNVDAAKADSVEVVDEPGNIKLVTTATGTSGQLAESSRIKDTDKQGENKAILPFVDAANKPDTGSEDCLSLPCDEEQDELLSMSSSSGVNLMNVLDHPPKNYSNKIETKPLRFRQPFFSH